MTWTLTVPALAVARTVAGALNAAARMRPAGRGGAATPFDVVGMLPRGVLV